MNRLSIAGVIGEVRESPTGGENHESRSFIKIGSDYSRKTVSVVNLFVCIF